MKINLDKLGEWAFPRGYAHPPAPLGGMTGTEHERVARPPAPVPATKQLRTNLERVTLAYNDRERVLVKEIVDREAELADVRRARDATTAALMELDVDLPELDVDAAQVAAMSDGVLRFAVSDEEAAAIRKNLSFKEAARHD